MINHEIITRQNAKTNDEKNDETNYELFTGHNTTIQRQIMSYSQNIIQDNSKTIDEIFTGHNTIQFKDN
jgi:hypothetical protein